MKKKRDDRGVWILTENTPEMGAKDGKGMAGKLTMRVRNQGMGNRA